MSPIQVTFRRTVGWTRSLFSSAVAVGAFLAISAVLFSFGLESSEGGRLPLSVVWATGVAPVLPALAAFLAMDVWSDERQSGRIDMLLTVAVRERDYVVGKFLGVLLMLATAVLLSLLLSLASLWLCAPQALVGAWVGSFVLAVLALLLQGAVWCAVSVALSAFFTRAAAAAFSSVVLLIALPRGLWAGLMTMSVAGRTVYGEMPLDAHVVDLALGVVPVGTVAGYLVVALTVLFIAVKRVASCRLVGRGARGLRFSTRLSVLLSVFACGLALLLAARVNPVVDISVSGASSALSPRTRSILAEAGDGVRITCILPRNHVQFRSVGHLLRQLQRESAAAGGAGIELRFVDPRWDIGAAERLIRRGFDENSLVFEKGRRSVSVRIDAQTPCGERLCASSIRRVSAPPQRRNVYWTTGHGETAYDAYGVFGMSDIARDLGAEGFRNSTIDLAASPQIPGDCALIVVAGAKDDFSRVEIGRLESYLKEGGRLLVLLGSHKAGGIVAMLPSWGIRPVDAPLDKAKTLSGSDVIVSEFSTHAVAVPLRGSRIVLEHPAAFEPSAVAEAGAGADRIGFSPVASVGSAVVAAAAERGRGTGTDIALRPTRIVAVGDASFVQNGQLADKASANRDFFLNCVAYLAGTEAHAFGGNGLDTLETGLDRVGRARHLLWSAAVFPLAVFLVLVLTVLRRRRRS